MRIFTSNDIKWRQITSNAVKKRQMTFLFFVKRHFLSSIDVKWRHLTSNDLTRQLWRFMLFFDDHDSFWPFMTFSDNFNNFKNRQKRHKWSKIIFHYILTINITFYIYELALYKLKKYIYYLIYFILIGFAWSEF